MIPFSRAVLFLPKGPCILFDCFSGKQQGDVIASRHCANLRPSTLLSNNGSRPSFGALFKRMASSLLHFHVGKGVHRRCKLWRSSSGKRRRTRCDLWTPCRPAPARGEAGRVHRSRGREVELGLPVVPFCQLVFGEGSPTKIDYRKQLVPLF